MFKFKENYVKDSQPSLFFKNVGNIGQSERN